MRFTDIKKIITESKEQLQDRLYDLEAAVSSARNITKQIKYADTHMTVIRELENLAEEVGIELDEYNVRQVYQANNNLESAVYELEDAFEEARRDIEMKIDELEFEEGITTRHSYDPVKPGGQSSPRKPVPVKGQKVTLDNVEYKVTHVSADRKTFDIVNVDDDRERHIDISVENNPFFIEGKSPHKKGSAKYKKHMAAKHAAMGEDRGFDSKPVEKIRSPMTGKTIEYIILNGEPFDKNGGKLPYKDFYDVMLAHNYGSDIAINTAYQDYVNTNMNVRGYNPGHPSKTESVKSPYGQGGESWYDLQDAKKLAKKDGKDPNRLSYGELSDYIDKAEKARKSRKDESLKALARHVKEGVPLVDSLFRYQSEAYFDTFKNAKKLREAGALPELDWESEEMLGTDIGESVELKGIGRVWLDVPYLDESDDYEMTTCDYCHGNEWDPDGPQDDDNYDDCPKCAGTGEIPKDDLGGSLTSEQELNDLRKRAGVPQPMLEKKMVTFNTSVGMMPGYDDHTPLSAEDYHNWTMKTDKSNPKPNIVSQRYALYVADFKQYVDSGSIHEAEYNGKKVQLNKPKRGGSKKYYVYVKNPKTGRVKKISFGDPGLKTKSGNKKRAKSFAARHNCEKKNDKMKAGYWACRLPRYGLVKGGKWW